MTISCKPVEVGVGRIAFEKKMKLFKTESWLRFSGLEWNIAHHFYLSSVRCVVNSTLDRFQTWTIWYAFMHFVLKNGICINIIHDSLKNKGGFCKHFYLFYLNSLYRWNFVVYILIFDFLVILNNWFYFSKKNELLWLTFKCLKAFLFKWKFLAYLCSGLLKRCCTGGISTRILKIWLCQMNPRWLAFLIELKFLAYHFNKVK